MSRVVSTSASEHWADVRATVPAVQVRGQCSFGARRNSLLTQLGDCCRGRRGVVGVSGMGKSLVGAGMLLRGVLSEEIGGRIKSACLSKL